MTNRERRLLERAVLDAVLRSLRPAMEQVMVAFRERLDEILIGLSSLETLSDESVPPRGRGRGQIGRPKRCSVCRLEGTRNDPSLSTTHTQDEHRELKAKAKAQAQAQASASASPQIASVRRRPLRAA